LWSSAARLCAAQWRRPGRGRRPARSSVRSRSHRTSTRPVSTAEPTSPARSASRCSRPPRERHASPARCRYTAARSRSRRATATRSPCSISARSESCAVPPWPRASRSERSGPRATPNTTLPTCISASGGPASPTATSTRCSSSLRGPPPSPRRRPLPPRTPRGPRSRLSWRRHPCPPRPRRRLRLPLRLRPPLPSACGAARLAAPRGLGAQPSDIRPRDLRAGIDATPRPFVARYSHGTGPCKLPLHGGLPCLDSGRGRVRLPSLRPIPPKDASYAARIGSRRRSRRSLSPRAWWPPRASRGVFPGHRCLWRWPCWAAACSPWSPSASRDARGRLLRRAAPLV
jgi:hypothetical protein